MTSAEIILAPPRSTVRPQVAVAAIAHGWLALTYGWSCLAVVTVAQTVGMARRLVRPTRGSRP